MSYTVHPFADHFPMMDDAAIARLAESIKRNGQREPIRLRESDNLVVDGRNRLAACQRAGVAPVTERIALTELETLDYIADLNIDRRHLTQSQKAEAAAEYARLAEAAQASGKNSTPGVEFSDELPSRGPRSATKAAAEKFGVSQTTVKEARRAIDADPEMAGKIKSGELSAKAAAKAVRQKSADKPHEQNGKPTAPEQNLDSLRRPIPERFIGIFLDERFRELATLLQRFKVLVKSIAHDEAAGHYLREHCTNLDTYGIKGMDSVRHAVLDDSRYHTACIACEATGKRRMDKCPSCGGCGWLTKYRYNQVKGKLEGEAATI